MKLFSDVPNDDQTNPVSIYSLVHSFQSVTSDLRRISACLRHGPRGYFLSGCYISGEWMCELLPCTHQLTPSTKLDRKQVLACRTLYLR